MTDHHAEASAFRGLRAVPDTSSAQWLVECLWPGRTLQVGSVVPDAYPANGRVLHPARSATPDGPDEIRWAAIAAELGTSIDSGVRFRDLVGWRNGEDPPFPYSAPLRGSLTEEQTTALAEVLAGFTSRPDKIWYCLWDGYGWPELPAPGKGPARVHLEHEDCLLFTGPITATASLQPERAQSPTLWWPDDRSWCVSTPVDGFSTYFGGAKECLDAVCNEPRLEAFPVRPDDLLDPSPYPA